MMLALILSLLLAQDAPAPLEEAPRRMTLPEGFKATLFAGEPDVVQPMAFAMDDRARLWVAESYAYPHWVPVGKEGRDRILIFEDADGDGKFDTRKVFHDKLANVSGIALGFGGVWITAVPYVLFIPDRNGDDVPDGPAEILLDGWDMKAKHNVFSKPSWGPDGWLYATNGIISQSKVGRPGTPPEQRLFINCGVWRFHPVTKAVEVVMWGTTNPWGLDWDEYGRGFVTNCVIKHLWHVIPGAHYQRMYGEDSTANLYGLMESCADHLHWAGGPWQKSRAGKDHADAGGGHAHVGAMVYLGDNWPQEYRGNLYTLNLHGNRMSRDVFETKGSGVVARHAKDFLLANDPWFRGLDLQYGPDGGVFVTDWSDTGECHDYDKADATNGRIYKVTYGATKPVSPDLGRLPDAELLKLQSHPNEWFGRHARRILHERKVDGKLDGATVPALRKLLREEKSETARLRPLWLLHLTGGLDEATVTECLASPEAHVRAWAIQLELEDRAASEPVMARLAELAKTDPSPVVRLALASGLQRLAPASRLAIAEGLVGREEDVADPNLPLMVWYGVEPIVSIDKERAIALLAKTKLPIVRQYITRRMAAGLK